MKQVTYAVLGYGSRGECFASLLRQPQLFGKVVAVAEPDADKREAAIRDCNLAPDGVFKTAEELLAQPRLADGLINTTMDRLHAETAIPAMEKGYHILLEKPMAVTLADCEAIEETQRKTGVIVCVCHSLRYHRLYAKIKQMIDSGVLGEVVSMDQIEGVGNIHQSHSYVRGNWANQAKSTFMLMAKSCHDIDILAYLAQGKKCERVSSFGSLTYFTPGNKPAGAPSRCLDGCPAESECPYHCGKVYLESDTWRFAFPKRDDASMAEYLREGPYGRCVFDCDNDVVDHQVVNLEYGGGLTATFTMTAFHPGGRHIRVNGTKGYVEGDMEANTIAYHDFISGGKTSIQLSSVGGSHGGGDYFVIKSLTEAIRANDPSAVLTTTQESLGSHRVVFAAERARIEKRVVQINELISGCTDR
ncbi:MAG: Gfo/Idh/MocA family protein [Armatimonadota bacterium]